VELGASRFLGLDPGEWTAVGTIALALATAAFVILTWRMAQAAKTSAADSAAAATSAHQAALAAHTANELLLAQLQVDFSVTYRVSRTEMLGNWADLFVTCIASTVYFHQLRLVGAVGPAAPGNALFDDEDRAPTAEEREAVAAGIAPTTLCPPPPSDFPLKLPYRMHGGETVNLLYPRPPLEESPHSSIRVRVFYSLTEEGEVRSIDREVAIPARQPSDTEGA
jgi:hypothetical protein